MDMIIDLIILIFTVVFCTVFPLWRWYQPKIEIIVLVKRRIVYLCYNKYERSEYKGRVHKPLFEVQW